MAFRRCPEGMDGSFQSLGSGQGGRGGCLRTVDECMG